MFGKKTFRMVFIPSKWLDLFIQINMIFLELTIAKDKTIRKVRGNGANCELTNKGVAYVFVSL